LASVILFVMLKRADLHILKIIAPFMFLSRACPAECTLENATFLTVSVCA